MNSPDYGTGAFAQRVADMLHGRSRSSPGSGDRVKSPARERLGDSPARERVVGDSPTRTSSSVDVARIMSKGDVISPGPTADAGRNRDVTPRPTSSFGGRRDTTSPGHRTISPGRRASTSPISDATSPARGALRQMGRPFGRFVTPEVAKEVRDAGLRLMKTPVLKVTELGDRFCELGKLLTRDKESAKDLLQMVVDLKKDTDKVWNSNLSVKELIQ